MHLVAIILFFCLSGLFWLDINRKHLQMQRNKIKLIRAKEVRAHLAKGYVNRWRP